MVLSCVLSWFSEPASCWPVATTASFAASLVGAFERLLQELQNADIWLARPALDGSFSAAWACWSSSDCVDAPLSAVFCVRYWESR